MHLLKELKNLEEQKGRLVVLEEDGKVYVVWRFEKNAQIVALVELDRPQDGQMLLLDFQKQDVYMLDPIEVIERVTEWK
ncbi:hypothetical protein MZM54_03785 [[Brevibacterium] frigoritolerans]|nr:hypothetical protein [Peribacillus frigoritolerans]